MGLVALDVAVDTTTPQGAAMAQILAVFAELERRLIGQRTKEAVMRFDRSRYVSRRRVLLRPPLKDEMESFASPVREDDGAGLRPEPR